MMIQAAPLQLFLAVTVLLTAAGLGACAVPPFSHVPPSLGITIAPIRDPAMAAHNTIGVPLWLYRTILSQYDAGPLPARRHASLVAIEPLSLEIGDGACLAVERIFLTDSDPFVIQASSKVDSVQPHEVRIYPRKVRGTAVETSTKVDAPTALQRGLRLSRSESSLSSLGEAQRTHILEELYTFARTYSSLNYALESPPLAVEVSRDALLGEELGNRHSDGPLAAPFAKNRHYVRLSTSPDEIMDLDMRDILEAATLFLGSPLSPAYQDGPASFVSLKRITCIALFGARLRHGGLLDHPCSGPLLAPLDVHNAILGAYLYPAVYSTFTEALFPADPDGGPYNGNDSRYAPLAAHMTSGLRIPLQVMNTLPYGIELYMARHSAGVYSLDELEEWLWVAKATSTPALVEAISNEIDARRHPSSSRDSSEASKLAERFYPMAHETTLTQLQRIYQCRKGVGALSLALDEYFPNHPCAASARVSLSNATGLLALIATAPRADYEPVMALILENLAAIAKCQASPAVKVPITVLIASPPKIQRLLARVATNQYDSEELYLWLFMTPAKSHLLFTSILKLYLDSCHRDYLQPSMLPSWPMKRALLVESMSTLEVQDRDCKKPLAGFKAKVSSSQRPEAGPEALESASMLRIWSKIVEPNPFRVIGTSWRDHSNYLAIVAIAKLMPQSFPHLADSTKHHLEATLFRLLHPLHEPPKSIVAFDFSGATVDKFEDFLELVNFSPKIYGEGRMDDFYARCYVVRMYVDVHSSRLYSILLEPRYRLLDVVFTSCTKTDGLFEPLDFYSFIALPPAHFVRPRVKPPKPSAPKWRRYGRGASRGRTISEETVSTTVTTRSETKDTPQPQKAPLNETAPYHPLAIAALLSHYRPERIRKTTIDRRAILAILDVFNGTVGSPNSAHILPYGRLEGYPQAAEALQKETSDQGKESPLPALPLMRRGHQMVNVPFVVPTEYKHLSLDEDIMVVRAFLLLRCKIPLYQSKLKAAEIESWGPLPGKRIRYVLIANGLIERYCKGKDVPLGSSCPTVKIVLP